MTDAMSPTEIFIAMQNSPHTQRAYRADLHKWYTFLASKGDQETPETVLAFKDMLITYYAGSTAQRIWCTVAAYYGWLKGTDRIKATPFQGIKSPSRLSDTPPPVPTDDEVTALLYACEDGTQHGARARIAIALMLNGLRAQEVCDAKYMDLERADSQNWMLHVIGKGGKWRTVPLNSEAQDAIMDYYFMYGSDMDDDHIVPSERWSNAALQTKAIWRMVDEYSRKAGVQHIHPHALRHHYATRLVRAGVSVFTLQKLLGHSRADTTQRYVNLDYTDLDVAVKLDPMHNPSVYYEFPDREVDHVPF